jgi:hypothetical protein
MRARSLFAYLVFTLFLFSSGLAKAGPVSAAEYGQRAYRDVLLRCPERIWPGIDWREIQFLFSDPNTRRGWLVSAGSQKPEVILKDQTIEDIFEDGFTSGFLDFRGLRTLAVNTAKLSDERAFRLAVRTAFRELGQAEWDIPEIDDRGALYPLLAEPRLLRRMAFESLKQAYNALAQKRDPKPFLAAAAFWQQRWQKKFPEEQAMLTDAVEGTALYTEQMAALLVRTGCGAEGATFQAAFQKFVLPELALAPGAQTVKEGAVIGSLSSFLLTALQPNWRARMNGRALPPSLLLQGVAPVWHAENPELRDAYRMVIDIQQHYASRRLTPVLDREKDPYFVRVSIPALWQRGGISLEPSYVLRDRRDTALLIFEKMHDFVSEKGSVHVPSHSLVFQTQRNACGGVFHILVPSFNVTRTNRRFSGAHAWYRFSFEGTRKVVNGFVWICPSEQ